MKLPEFNKLDWCEMQFRRLSQKDKQKVVKNISSY